MSTFNEMIEARSKSGNFLCIGLDPDIEKIPQSIRGTGTHETLVSFNRVIIDATLDIALAYKPNSAFYEAHGDQGWSALRETIAYINESNPDIPVILDSKRADIGNTNEGYVQAAFDHLHAHAITVHPYFGREALEPFLARTEKGIIVLVKSSNKESAEFQNLPIQGEPLYKVVAKHVSESWNSNGNCGVMVGATYPEELAQVRSVVGDMQILIPGIGAQNGDLEKTVKAGKNSHGRGIIVSASRSVIFASPESDFAERARAKAQELHEAIKKAL